MAAVVEKEPEIVDESDGDEEVPEDAYDVLESALSGEYGSDHGCQYEPVRQERRQERAAGRPQSCEYWPMPRHARRRNRSSIRELDSYLFKLLQTKCFCEARGLPLDGQGGECVLCFER